MPKAIPLSRGAVAQVDDADYARVAAFKWSLDRNGYAVRKRSTEDGWRKVMLHRFILRPPQGMDVDHIDGDPLNCTRSNMRLATRSQNSANRGPGKGRRFKGVYQRASGLYYATICVQGQRLWLGNYAEEQAAAAAYDAAALKHFGEFAWLNFPTPA